MLNEPKSRGPAARAVVEAVGAEYMDGFYSVSQNQAVMLLRAEPEQLTELELIVMASRAFTDVSVETLVSFDQMHNAMVRGQSSRTAYQGANLDEIDRMLLDE
tara:strand:- start:68 stop:376 length:309 start_codon:yes stop_codon:yes gene_type:complete